MDLFKLLGIISINNSDAIEALDETSKSGKNAESKLGKAFKAVGNGAVAVGKTIATGMAVGATAVGALVTASVQSYADYEQLVGGVDTLFKESSAKVQEYAKNAYKTAGLSANEYMETVTSFSASLLQGLDGDTTKATEIANRAITDMSDNANKMGTDITMIQNAYQGFAKQNYTMLDNLKLGYGGTQAEMARLINDSGVLGDSIEVTAETVNSVSFDKIIEAIGVVQDRMGITGTTALEASSTISGSFASMKSSWQNLLTAISSDELPFDTYVTNFVESVSTVADNLMPRIEIALGGVVQLIGNLAPVIISEIPSLFSSVLPSVVTATEGLINSIVSAIPDVVSVITDELLPELLKAFKSVFSKLGSTLPTITKTLISGLKKIAPSLVTTISEAVVSIGQLLPQILEPILSAIPELALSLSSAILSTLPELMMGLQSLLDSLIAMAPVLLPQFIQAIVSIVNMVVEQLPVILPFIVQLCLTIISLLQEQLPVLLPLLINALISIIYLLIEQLPVIIPMLIDACITVTMAIVQALPDILKALTDALPTILQAVWDAIVMVFKNLPQWFGQIFQGAVDIIKGVWSVVKTFFKGIWDAICQVFAPVGDYFDKTFGDAWGGVVAIWKLVEPFFKAVWESIKAVFSVVKEFFVLAFKNAWEGIKLVFGVAGDFFKAIWNTIKGVFSVVKHVLSGNFKDAWEAIKDVFSGWGEFFGNLWNRIKNAFSKIGTNIGDAVSKSVKAGINGLLGSAENIINGFLGMINSAISMINAIPGVNISKVKLVSFTRLAEGGVVDKPTPAVFGEDGAEAVVPLENNTGWIRNVAKQIHEFSLETKDNLSNALSTRSIELQEKQLSETQTINSKLDNLINLLTEFFPDLMSALMEQVMVLDDGTLVAKMAPRMEEELGNIAIMKGRGR